MWTDAHCHLSDLRLENTIESLLKQSNSLGISKWVQGGVSPEDWQNQLSLKARFPGQILTSFGMHPWWVSENSELTLEEACQKLENSLPQADAFGEVGLDFGKRFASREVQEKQKKYFELQLGLLKTIQKPLVLHVVEAHALAIETLKKHKLYGGIVHSFSASLNEANAYMDLGLSLSISGVVTREGYKKLKEAAKALPKDKIVIETDCPDQKPLGVQTLLNTPENLLIVAEAVAKLRGETKEEVLRYTTENCERIFKKC